MPIDWGGIWGGIKEGVSIGQDIGLLPGGGNTLPAPGGGTWSPSYDLGGGGGFGAGQPNYGSMPGGASVRFNDDQNSAIKNAAMALGLAPIYAVAFAARITNLVVRGYSFTQAMQIAYNEFQGHGGPTGGGTGDNLPPPPPFPGGGLGPLDGTKTGGNGLPVAQFPGMAIVETPTMTQRVMRRPGYVTVTLPISIGGFSRGMKVQMLKSVARQFGLWKPRQKPALTASDVRALRKAERVENKLVGLTKRHTDFSVKKKVRTVTASKRR